MIAPYACVRGVQQGPVEGMPFFCAALHSVFAPSHLPQSVRIVAFAVDVFIVGEPTEVHAVVGPLGDALRSRLHLDLQSHKSKWASHPDADATMRAISSAFPRGAVPGEMPCAQASSATSAKIVDLASQSAYAGIPIGERAFVKRDFRACPDTLASAPAGGGALVDGAPRAHGSRLRAVAAPAAPATPVTAFTPALVASFACGAFAFVALLAVDIASHTAARARAARRGMAGAARGVENERSAAARAARRGGGEAAARAGEGPCPAWQARLARAASAPAAAARAASARAAAVGRPCVRARGVDGGVVGCAVEPLLAVGCDAQGGGARCKCGCAP
ncbi:hypothetical protein KFE25_011558 [Diacronema lutheri]|uniref:Uncharacterized protein n=1 Tax=Diacronema lutheri TaxID=2081491 RepID=A0A8J5X925_DIALT|nr:hypothetical protein KFE25_011558 [Diacronema lutheri]